jgi:hypothetical protein
MNGKIALVFAAVLPIVADRVLPALAADLDYQAHFLYVGEDPSNESPGWYDEPSGLAHSDTHWYITETARIWKIPVHHDLGDVDADSPGVWNVELTNYPDLWAAGSRQLGHPCAYPVNGSYYLLAPISDSDGADWFLAVFRDDGGTFDYVALADFPAVQGGHWCGVDDAGRLYSSAYYATNVTQFNVDWSRLAKEDVLVLTPIRNVIFQTSTGGLAVRVDSADVSVNGELLYVVDHPLSLSDGQSIQVFDLASGYRVQKSTHGSGYFDFDVSWEVVDALTYADGIAIWDLAGTGSPHRGEMHVIITDTDTFSGDEIGIKHYTRAIRVDPAHYNHDFPRGTPEFPLDTIGSAMNFAWNGAEIQMYTGHYNEPMTITKRVRLTPIGGVVRIGG